MNSIESAHAALARRVGFPQVARPFGETQDQVQPAVVASIQPQPTALEESQLADPTFSPAGSLFDGSDEEDNDDVSKLALDSRSNLIASEPEVSLRVMTTRSVNHVNSSLGR